MPLEPTHSYSGHFDDLNGVGSQNHGHKQDKRYLDYLRSAKTSTIKNCCLPCAVRVVTGVTDYLAPPEIWYREVVALYRWPLVHVPLYPHTKFP